MDDLGTWFGECLCSPQEFWKGDIHLFGLYDFFQLVKHHTSAKGILLAEPSWMISVRHASICSLEGSGEWTHALCLEDTRMSEPPDLVIYKL